MNILYTLIVVLLSTIGLQAQNQNYWQQRAEYTIDISMDVTTHKFTGTQKLVYYNNSPDTLNKVYYHLYFNAFQPGSMMDVRSRSIIDPDRRVGDRISKLTQDQIGYQHIISIKQDGKTLSSNVQGTLFEVTLNKPILSGGKATFEMEFEAQVPIQIRRTGRDNAEGIDYSMSQWYPKLAEYDYQGWHTDPYIGREFHGVWSDFDVKITIDSNYTLAGTGYLQNPDKIGHGYERPDAKVENKSSSLTWHYKAPNVIDFVWAADPDYKHSTAKVPDGPILHFFYLDNEGNKESWESIQEYMVKAMSFVSKNFGKYPYEQYSFIQGGDGGMEYPMATLIKGNQSFKNLLGTAVHEMIHSWYQGVLGTNESLYPWMDEGFTSYAEDVTLNELTPGKTQQEIHKGTYARYFSNVKSGNEEPLTTHADHYITNRSHGINAYSKGSVFLNQLSYVIGQETLMRGMRRYYHEWKFKHPTPNDFIRIMEKESDIELDWYLEQFVMTTNQIDYGIKSLIGEGDNTYITLERHGEMMMPIDLNIEYNDGTKEIVYIPLRLMRGAKPVEDSAIIRITKEAWPWTYPTYTLKLNRKTSEIKKVEIDSSLRMADINRDNNIVDVPAAMTPYTNPQKDTFE
jgi:hypothetical protein